MEQPIKTFVISIGIINIPSGKTQFDWSIYDHPIANVYLTDRGSLLYASEGTFNIGNKVSLIYNDGGRKVSGQDNRIIIGISKCIKEEVIEFLFKNGYDYKPKKAFASAKFSRKLGTSFSVKGTTL